METIINHIHISNFKSLKDVTLDQCRRINLIIGKPNVGKSNLLEAMSLFCLPYLKYTRKRSIQQFIRTENDAELFFDGHVDSPISVKTNKVNVEVKMDNMGLLYSQTNPAHPAQDVAFTISNLTIPAKKNIDIPTANPFKCYLYPPAFDKEKLPIPFLLPPGGSNLMNIVSMMPKLKEELRTIFNDYGLKYVFDTNSQEIKVMKEKKPGEIFLIPFHSIADTLQRMIFYKAAIESNSESALVFEEPEVVPLLPKFMTEEETLTGAPRGTAYHRVMELLDFEKMYDRQTLEAEINTFVEQGRMTREMADSVQTADVLGFLDSSVGKRTRTSADCGKLWKEQPFVLGIPEQELYKDEPEGDFALVQGIIDVYFEEEDGLVVLDYKTDKVYKIEELVEKYHAQLDYYGRALEQITGKKVKEKVLYSFTLGEACSLS